MLLKIPKYISLSGMQDLTYEEAAVVLDVPPGRYAHDWPERDDTTSSLRELCT